MNRCILAREFRLSPPNCLHTSLRLKSKEPKKTKRYTQTLNLPKTNYQLTLRDGAAIKRELNIQKVCSFDELYLWQRREDRKQQFVLHDGPPYANGSTHVGHAINKILKDIVNRYKLLQGYKIHYVPGWDCHGLPIELKALEKGKSDHKKMEPLEIRKKAKDFAVKVIQTQKESFKQWGIMADWEKCYVTLDPEYQATQLEVLYKMFDKGFVYRDYMPVYWSPSSRTALAESELEYNNQHVSKSVYVKFLLSEIPDTIRTITDKPVYAVIWTTTPWTLPFNQAVCYNHNIKYELMEHVVNGEVYLCEAAFSEKLRSILDQSLTSLAVVDGKDLKGIMYKQPLTNQNLSFISADHVTSGKGTGLVHTAPAHGHDDFQIAVKHKLPVECKVDEDGRYMKSAGDNLYGKTIGIDADQTVIDLLKDNLLHVEDYVHSYPYDWRTKLPVITRASKQWFINTNIVKKRALECLKDVEIIPKTSENGMINQLQTRPYWCISRQRVWGVPFPVFYNKQTGDPVITKESIEHICGLIRNHGSDIWWSWPVTELLPHSLLEQLGPDVVNELVKGEDILDIWFDSGTSWATVLKDVDNVADVYLEGLDQFGGWFQTSLLTSIAVNNKPPYKQLIVHGFTTDEKGKKMSKSVGNVVDPSTVIHGGKNKSVEPSYGVDVLRWWTARSHLETNIMIGPAILDKFQTDIFNVRKCLRFLLGNISDFDPNKDAVEYSSLLPQDQYMLHLLYIHCQNITKYYEEYHFSKVLLDMEKFINTDFSFYSSIIKDRCYCEEKHSVERLSSITVQYHMIDMITKSLAPILPHVAEEVYQFYPNISKEESVFKSSWYSLNIEWKKPDLKNKLECILDIRKDLNSILAAENTLEYDVVIYASQLLHDILKEFQKETTSSTSSLNEILQMSHTSLLDKPPTIIPEDSQSVEGLTTVYVKGMKWPEKFKLIIIPAMDHICERCRRYTSKSSTAPCDRCLSVLADDWIN
ncbi:isoleucine--tRNA ligase, mitochondrial [Patella vulgata]|uniref:isoleucine--tRNA ligase, mitochondrial n=1 Tax=Patella vulgata TaxID=6465 RepID=UPI0024A90294|nr:isoleucine--tRNA ligase, mitochondrial [Patella vulgata]